MNYNNLIEDYLSSKGVYPAKKYKNYSMYHAPYREDRTPSMKVQGDVFMDFGTGIGGGLKKLKELMNEVGQFYIPKTKKYKNLGSRKSSPFNVIDKKVIGTNPLLNNYLKARCIDLDIAAQYCQEIYYTNGEKSFFAIGLPTVNKNYFSIRNSFFKGKIGNGVSYFQNGYLGKNLKIFEGMFSMLSYFQSFKYNDCDLLKGDVLVLNSLSNLNNIRSYVDKYAELHLMLDRDESGYNASQKVLMEYPHAIDCSEIYNGYVDMNDMLIGRSKMIENLKIMVSKKR
ncbi:toprim domain-containing protein [Sphingobacterium cellulitidis]|uniref:toprim domain-containing protein n=1 Tax=Sphingobacterium cellulitidis TaxID=1768011 RepID=UPI000B94203A|nr:hypothetical protein CHT99_10120 [Sphingobacterium cellulitidis]